MSQKGNIEKGEERLGVVRLTALVFGMMVGSGIFNIAQNLAAGAGLGAMLIGWGITAFGMLMLVSTFRVLSERFPNLRAGIYLYAEKGFGRFAGFNVAWGYWLCACFANVAYLVMLNDAIGSFYPSLLNHGVESILFCSVLVWILYFILGRGLRTTSIIATCAAVAKFAIIFLILILLILYSRYDILTSDVWGFGDGVGNILAQVKSTMLVTLWCFIGIEGAVVMSGRAKRRRDVGRAGISGFLLAWVLYVLVSVFCYAIMTRARLANLEDPSVAYALKTVCGPWAYWLVIFAIIISISGGLFAWMLVTAEQPYSAARQGLFPRILIKGGGRESMKGSLLASCAVMQGFLLLVMLAEDVYLYALDITSLMILPAYLFSGLFLLKTSWRSMKREGKCRKDDLRIRCYVLIGALCTAFCIWMMYAAGLMLLMQGIAFYALGIIMYRRKDIQSK
ncbi:MAG: basic amino acid/polyamine antiporter [Muribaculum sp.]|nr:basic amino acid/polyamine antiporter [Muribaculum sp.]